MDITKQSDLPNTPLRIVKTVFLFIGRSILIILGLLVIIAVLWRTFEQSISFLEISTLEAVFFVVLFFQLKNYFSTTSNTKMQWKQVVYRPIRNLGWFGVMTVIIIFSIMFMQKTMELPFRYENLIQVLVYVGFGLCIYLATPTKADDQNNIAKEGAGE